MNLNVKFFETEQIVVFLSVFVKIIWCSNSYLFSETLKAFFQVESEVVHFLLSFLS